MKKKSYNHIFNLQEWLKKGALPGACIIFWLLTGISSTKAATTPEQDSITFSKQQMMVEQVFDAITKQLKYDVFYSENELDVKRIVQLPRLKMGLIEVLNFVLQKEFTYKFNGKTIIISPAKATSGKHNQIRGIVKDENGEPLPGVTIIIKGTTIGVSTNVKGEFTIISPEKPEATPLIFSFIGMETQQVTPKSDFITVTMKTTLNELDEVIVRTGYENIDKRKLTSSIVTVKMDDIMEPITTTLDNMLQGKIPGMAVLQQSSTIGAAPKIRIRGSSTIVGNREPLWVLDGIVLEDPVPLKPEELNSMDRVNLIGNAISGINPEDIEQIDVLKDASATALYGSKAGNGVIMITTKKGKFGKPAISYNTSMGFTHRPTIDRMHLMNSKERIEVSEEMFERGLEYVDFNPTGTIGYEGLLLQMFNNKLTYSEFKTKVKQLKEQNTDWYKELFRNSFTHNHTLSVSGANDLINYYFSVGYSNARGATLQEESERFNFSTNLHMNISKKLSVGFALSASNGDTKRPHSSIDLYQYAYSTSRAIAPFDENGDYNYYDMEAGVPNTPNLVYNIFNELNTTGQSSSTFSMNTRFNLDYKITSCLNLSALVAYNVSSSKSESWAAEDSYFISKKRRLKYGEPLLKPTEDNFGNNCSLPYGGILNASNNKNINYTTRFTASFYKAFGVHDFSLMAGMETRSVHYDGITSTVLGYLPDRGKKHVDADPRVWFAYGGLLKDSQPVLTDNKKNEMSYFASFSYSYDNRYILNANVRGDASNKFGQDKSARFLPIWSFSGRWNIADEHFMKNVNWMQGLNIHASYGLQGNVTDAHNPNMVANIGTLDEVSQQYISTLASLPNRGLRWEKTSTYNIGTDFSFFNGRLSAMFEWFSRKSKNQLISTTIESTNGGTSVTLNDGNVTNTGWDLSFSAIVIRKKDVAWNLSFNTSQAKNKVKDSGEMNKMLVSSYLDGSLVQNNKPLNSFYSYRFAKINEKGEPTFYGLQGKDEEGNILISTREEAIEQGLVYSGRREPVFTGGLSTSLRVKRFTLNTSFSLQFGSKIRLNDLYNDGQRLPYPAKNMTDEFVNRWRKPGDEKHTNIPKLTDESTYPQGIFTDKGNPPMGNNIYEFYNKSDLRVVSGNFARCRSISLAYYFNPDWLKQIYMRNASVSFSVSNPFVISGKGLHGKDPEQVTLGSGSIPPQRNYSLSIGVTF